ncbi:IS110 family transposase [Burkholderia sp. Ac-20384]|uniref:transposase n=1 Tax=Burkholderia sp. Ac-20384 TaxID=2703902 RepID=UPI00197CE4CA|nr:transposase [Burkholderia sp. Ac-20384]MBN3823771.1 IS110 family transposase [Burkholderia sp. Ac-20384]
MPKELQDASGIGRLAATSSIAELPKPGQLNQRRSGTLPRVRPYVKDLGSIKGSMRIAAARSEVRCALYPATLTASRLNPVGRAFYDRLAAAGRLKKASLTTRMRTLDTPKYQRPSPPECSKSILHGLTFNAIIQVRNSP